MKITRANRLLLGILFIPAWASSLTSCDKVDFWIWGPENHRQVYLKAVEDYRKLHPEFTYKVGFAGKGDAGVDGNVQKDVETAGSILILPNDELVSLRRMGALSPLLEDENHNDQTWVKKNHVPASVEATKIGDKYLAYPISADNGFVFVYNKKAFEGTSVWDSNKNNGEGGLKENYTFRDLYSALDNHPDNSEYDWKGGGKVLWPIGSAWYESGVFFATGCDYSVEYDEEGKQKSVECDFGDPKKGIRAVCCMINTATNADGSWSKRFVFTDDSDPAYNDYVSAHIGKSDLAKKEPLAGIVTWNNPDLRKNWGDDYAADVLPKLETKTGGNWINIDDDPGVTKYTWRSFSGFKLLAVNPFSRFARKGKNVEILHDLARYLAGPKVSVARYEANKMGPSNIEAQEVKEIKEDKFLTALDEQFSLKEGEKVIGSRTQDSTPKNFWTPIARVGKAIWETIKDKKTADGVFSNIDKARSFLKQVENDIKSSGEQL